MGASLQHRGTGIGQRPGPASAACPALHAPTGPWLALWLALPVAASPAFCVLLALDAGTLVGLDAAAAREVAIGLTLDLFRLWIAATLAAGVAIALAARRATDAP